MGFIQHLNTLLWLFGLLCLISNTDAQSQTKRSSRITSSRTSFGTNVKSSSNPSSNGVNFDCPEEFGYYPHPTDCTQYYVCVFGGALLESCTGGLMYSHELQTCDWPRNVGCEVVDSGERDDRRNQAPQQQQQTNANQHVPSRVRFGAAFTSQQQQTQAPQQVLKPTIPPQYHRQPPQVIQAQVQTIPPPPELKVPPNPVVTSRGQPKHLLEAQEEIAKLYADAHETLPPVEEEENDRQQRVYRGQPSTVSQVQKDRDGIIHQASINAIPNNDKFSSYAFGTQYRTDINDLDLLYNELDNVFVIDSKDLDLNVHKRYKRDLGLDKKVNEEVKQVQTEVEVLPTNNAEDLNVMKYSSKFSSNENETMIAIENLVKELYGPEYKISSTDELMELMNLKVERELEIAREILKQQSSNEPTEEMLENGRKLEDLERTFATLNRDDSQKYEKSKQIVQEISQISTSSASYDSTEVELQNLGNSESTSDAPTFNISNNSKALNNSNQSTTFKTSSDTQTSGSGSSSTTVNSLSDFQTKQNSSDSKYMTNISTHIDSSTSIDRLDENILRTDNFNQSKILENQETDNFSNKPEDSDLSDNSKSAVDTEQVTKINEETQTEILTFPRDPEDLEYMDTGDNNAAESIRTIRQLRPYTADSRAPWLSGGRGASAGNNYRSIDSNPYHQQVSYSFGAFNPYLTPPSTPSYAPLNSVNSQYKPNNYQHNLAQSNNYKQQKPKVVYTGYNLSLPPPMPTSSEDDFRPIVGNYYTSGTSSTTSRPTYLKNTDLLPYILKSLQELKEQRKKLQAQNFAYFHLDNQPAQNDKTTQRPLTDYKATTQKVTPNSHFSQISTVGGFYNNNKNVEPQTYRPHIHNPYINQGDNFLPTTTESNYFKYNLIANQKMKNYYSTLKTPSSTYEFTTFAPVTSNFNVVTPPKLMLQQGNYVDFNKYSNGITYDNNSSTITDSYPIFTTKFTTTEASLTRVPLPELEISTKKPIKLQFNLPDFLSNLQSKDMAHLNPAVVDMLKYFKEVNKPLETLKQATKPKLSTLNINEVEGSTTSTKRPTKGYENFLNSLNKPATLKTTTTSKPPMTLNTEEYYDEYEEEEEENESEGIDADDEIQPPSKMPPYMPMTETMAPPRSQMMPQLKPMDNPLKNQQTYNTGFYQATSTRRPLFTPNFEQFYQPHANTQSIPNQIPSFINFPSDYFQEIKPKLPVISDKPLQTPQYTIKTSTLGFTTRLTSTTPTTIKSTTTTPRPMTTTTTSATKQRYTIRPNRFRGQNRWQPSTTSTTTKTTNNNSNSTTTMTSNNNNNNSIRTLTLDLKHKTIGLKKRPTSLASSSIGLNSGSSSSLNMNSNLDLNGQINNKNRIESSSPSSSSIQSTPATIYIQTARPTPQQHLHQQQQVIVETIPSTQTQNRNQQQQQQQQQYRHQQQLSPPLPTLAQPQPFSQNRNYYNTSTSYNNHNNNQNNHNVDVVSYIPQQQQHQQHLQQQQQQPIPLQHSSQNQQQPLISQSQNDNVQQSEQSPYDTYYSVYDDDIDLYRDIEYQQQQQQQQQQHRQPLQQQPQYQQPIRTLQQSTYRPLDIFTTPQPQTAQRETYKTQQKPQDRPTYQSNQQPQERPTYQSNQQPLVYNTDYDEDLIAQIEQDNAYDQPTRPPPRKEQVSIQSLNSGPSSTDRTLIDENDERNYYSTLTTPLPPPLNNVNNADEPTYIYETEYVDEPDYYYQDKLRRPVQPIPTTYRPKIKATLNNPNDDYNIIGIKLHNSQNVNQNKPKTRINTRPETVTSSATRTTKPTTPFRTTTSTTTTTTTPKPSTTKLSRATIPSITTTKSRSKQTHAKKLQQQEQLLQQVQPQSKSQQPHKHFRQEPPTTTTQSHISYTSSTTSKSTTTLIPTTHKPKFPLPQNPLTVVNEPENPTIRVVAQTQSNSRQVQNYQPSRIEKDPNLQSLEDIETVYDESQNVHVQSAEPPKSRGTGTQYISASNDRGVYVNENSPNSNPRGNFQRLPTDKSLNEFKSKSYDIYGGLKSNDFVEDQKSKNSKDLSAKKLIKSYIISDIAPQSFKPAPTEKNVAIQQDSAEDIEVLNGASSSTTTLRYPGTFKTSTEAKPFEYSLQTGKNGFTLRAQHLGLGEDISQPLYERRPAIQYFTTATSSTTAKTTSPTTTTTTTTEAPTTSTTSTTSTTTTERPSFRPHTEIVYVESYYEDDLQPTTYAPPLRTWRNGRPTIQTTSTTTTANPQSLYDYSYRIATESSKLQSVAKEYLPRFTTTTSSTTTTTTTPRTTTTTTTPRSTTTTIATTTTPKTTSTSTTLASTERPVQTFTARASVFKDNLQKTTIASNQRFVSPYKSLETLLQKEERSSFSSARSTVKPKNLPLTSTAHPFLQTTNKPLRSYFLITSPPKNLNETLFATMASNNRNFSISDALISSARTNHKATFSTTTTTTTTTTEMPNTSIASTTPITMSTIINTSPLRVNAYQRNEVSEKPRPRGRSRYTVATATNLLDNDEPTTYSPKNRFKPFEQDITTTPSSALQGRRKIQRARIAALQNQRNNPSQSPKPREKYQSFKQELKKHYENEAIEQTPKAEALIAGPVDNQQDNSIESTKSTETTEREHVVAITDRPLKYYYSNKYRQQTGERSLAESLQNAGYITSSTKPGNKIFKPVSVLEQLQLFLAGSDSDENESSSPQFVQDFSEPEIKAAVQEIKNLYASTGQRPSWTTTTTTTLRPTSTAKPPTTAYSNTTPSTTQSNLNAIKYTSTYSTPAPSTQAQISSTSPSTTSTSTTTTTTPKNFPKFPSSTYSFLTSSSSFSTTTSTTTTPAYASYSSQAYNKASSGAGIAAPSSSSASLGNVPPARVSRVNNALKSSIAAAATASSSTSSLSGNGNNAGQSSSSTTNSAAAGRSNKFSLGSTVKCSDTTSNAKCNEIPTRINSNSNRNRGSASSNYQGDRDIGSAPVTSNRGTHPPRTRPTLKPSGTIVSKAQEFVDIYRNPPSRPDPLYPTPQPDKTAAKCRKDVCLLPDCSCGGRDIPGDMPVEQVPQIVLITFDDSVNDLNKQLYLDLFEKGRVNPNGCPITATFYVSHEWTDYSQVQNLYSDGHEMASHTISHSFGEQFSQKKWTREIAGQREILAAYGGVKLSDVRGMRAPFLSVGGNKMYKMLYDSNFTYDSSMPVYENRPPSWPYTLDYKIFHDCMIPPCPTKSYPGVWQVPMVMWQDLNGGRCSMGDACSNPSDAEGVSKMIMKNFERHYTTNRAPFGLFYHAAWFTQPHHKEGFIKFLDTINAMQDVWIVTNWQALQWVRDPTPISRINSFQPFQCDYSDRPKRCNNPKVCNLWHKSGVRYMKTCQPCPDIYPWTGKTGIRSSRIDNDIEDSTA